MAGETSQPRRSRPVSGTSGDSDPTLTSVDPAMAPITANTPLPPLTPLPLASESSSANTAPAPGGPPNPAYQPAAPPPQQMAAPPYPSPTAGSGVSSTWAAYSLFALMFTSLILIVIMAVAAAVISKNPTILFWIIALTVVVNVIYTVVVFAMLRPDAGQSFRSMFTRDRRGA